VRDQPPNHAEKEMGGKRGFHDPSRSAGELGRREDVRPSKKRDKLPRDPYNVGNEGGRGKTEKDGESIRASIRVS